MFCVVFSKYPLHGNIQYNRNRTLEKDNVSSLLLHTRIAPIYVHLPLTLNHSTAAALSSRDSCKAETWRIIARCGGEYMPIKTISDESVSEVYQYNICHDVCAPTIAQFS